MVFVELPTLTPIVVLRDWVTAGLNGVGAAEGDELGPIVGLAKDGCNEGGVVGGEVGCNEGGVVGGEVGAWRNKEEETVRVRLRYVGTGILEHDH